MTVSLIAALTKNRVIGRNNDLPWNLPDDMKYFMQTTKGHPVIMGRKNYESIPEKFRPLPNRTNIIITRQPDFYASGCIISHSLSEAISAAAKLQQDEIFLIGGSQIYKEGIALCTKMYLTEIEAVLEGDVFFPEIKMQEWKAVSKRNHEADSRHIYSFDFVVYERILPER